MNKATGMGNHMINMKKDDAITIAKGIGIILMVVGHSGTYNAVVSFIYMFHMPLFFLLAGYCFKERYLDDFKTFAWRRIKGLYWPFVKWGLLFLLLHNLFFHLNIYNGVYGYGDNVSHMYSLHEMASKGIFGTLLFTSSEELLGGFWFLIQLFWASLIGFAMIKLMKSKALLGVLLLLCITIAIIQFYGRNIPYTAIGSLSTFGAAFFVAGHLMRKFEIKSHGIWGLGCLFAVIAAAHLTHASMDRIETATLIPFFITAILGTLMTLQLSRYIAGNKLGTGCRKFLTFTGDNTLQILTWHFLSFKLVSLIVIAAEGLPIEMLAMFPTINDLPRWYSIFYALAGVGLPLIGVLATRKIADLNMVSRLRGLYRQR